MDSGEDEADTRHRLPESCTSTAEEDSLTGSPDRFERPPREERPPQGIYTYFSRVLYELNLRV